MRHFVIPALLMALFVQLSYGQAAAAVSNALCSIYYVVNTILFVLSLMLMILGGAVYAGAGLLPGQTRGGLQAYGWGIILGGVAGAIIGITAPWILSWVTGSTVTQILSACAGAGGIAAPAAQYTVSVTSNPAGVTGLTGGGNFAPGTDTITAPGSATIGTSTYTFLSWSGSGAGSYSGSLASAAVTISDQDISEIAVYTGGSTACSIVAGASPSAGGTTTGTGAYTCGTAQQISASANPNYVFTGWTCSGGDAGAPCYGGGDDTDNLQVGTSATDVEQYTETADFETVGTCQITLQNLDTSGGSLSASPGGTSTGASAPCGTTFTITAAASGGWVFEDWMGSTDMTGTPSTGDVACTGSSATCQVTTVAQVCAAVCDYITEDGSFTQQCVVITQVSPMGAGTTSPGAAGYTGPPCSGTEQISVTSTAPDFTFKDWSTAGTGCSNPNSATASSTTVQLISGDTCTYTAIFTPPTCTITATSSDTDYGTVTPSTESLPCGNSYSFTESPEDPEDTFIYWGCGTSDSACPGSDTSTTYTLTTAAGGDDEFSLIGNFQGPCWIGTSSSPSADGGVTPSGTYSVACNTGTSVQANPDSGFEFDQWDPSSTFGSGSTNPTLAITPQTPGSATSPGTNEIADFVSSPCPVSTYAVNGGTATTTGATSTCGTDTFSVTGTIPTGYTFDEWVCYNPSTGQPFPTGQAPSECYQGPGVGSYPTYTTPSITTSAAGFVTFAEVAVFTPPTCVVNTQTGTGEGAYGYVSAGQSVPCGSPATITATSTSPGSFIDWQCSAAGGCYAGTNPGPDTFTTSASYNPVTETAYFSGPCSVGITLDPSDGGSVTPGSGSNYVCNTPYSPDAQATGGWTFNSWISCTGPGCYLGTNPNPSFTLEGDITETANFIQNQCTITVSASPADGGGLSPAGPVGGACDPSQAVQITATPAPGGWTFASWTCSPPSATSEGCETAGSSSPTIEVTPTGSFTEIANFNPPSCTVNVAVAGTGGTVSGGASSIPCGQDVTIGATPSGTYNFAEWSCNPTAAAGNGCYSGATPNPPQFPTSSSYQLVTETASFTAEPVCTIQGNPPSDVAITPVAANPNTVVPCGGDSGVLTATAPSGERFTGWTCTETDTEVATSGCGWLNAQGELSAPDWSSIYFPTNSLPPAAGVTYTLDAGFSVVPNCQINAQVSPLDSGTALGTYSETTNTVYCGAQSDTFTETPIGANVFQGWTCTSNPTGDPGCSALQADAELDNPSVTSIQVPTNGGATSSVTYTIMADFQVVPTCTVTAVVSPISSDGDVTGDPNNPWSGACGAYSTSFSESPNSGYTFTGWTCSPSTDAGCTALGPSGLNYLNQPGITQIYVPTNAGAPSTGVQYTLYANYVPTPTCSATASSSSTTQGTVNPSSAGPVTCNGGTLGPFTATPIGNNQFVDWTCTPSGDAGCSSFTAASTSISITTNTAAESDIAYTLVGTFSSTPTYDITVDNFNTGDGSIYIVNPTANPLIYQINGGSLSTYAAAEIPNNAPQVWANPGPGYYVKSIACDLGCTGPTQPSTTTSNNVQLAAMTQSVTYGVTFAANSYTLKVQAGTGGTTSATSVVPQFPTTCDSSSGCTEPYGYLEELTAVPNSGYAFLGWTCTSSATPSTCTGSDGESYTSVLAPSITMSGISGPNGATQTETATFAPACAYYTASSAYSTGGGTFTGNCIVVNPNLDYAVEVYSGGQPSGLDEVQVSDSSGTIVSAVYGSPACYTDASSTTKEYIPAGTLVTLSDTYSGGTATTTCSSWASGGTGLWIEMIPLAPNWGATPQSPGAIQSCSDTYYGMQDTDDDYNEPGPYNPIYVKPWPSGSPGGDRTEVGWCYTGSSTTLYGWAEPSFSGGAYLDFSDASLQPAYDTGALVYYTSSVIKACAIKALGNGVSTEPDELLNITYWVENSGGTSCGPGDGGYIWTGISSSTSTDPCGTTSASCTT